MSNRSTNIFLGVLIAAQIASLASVNYNNYAIDKALPDAAAKGQDTFEISQLFSFTGTSLTMVNGWRSRTNPKACTVNLVNSDNGVAIKDYSGLLLD